MTLAQGVQMAEATVLGRDTMVGKQGAEGDRSSGYRPVETSGFTAVNAENSTKHNPTLLQPSKDWTSANGPNMAYPALATLESHSQPGWRAAVRTDSVLQPESSFKQSPESLKRKRAEDSHEIPTTVEEQQLKRRNIESEAGSPDPVDRSSTNSGSGSGSGEEATRARIGLHPTSRERTPVPTWKQREPLPQVRPDTEASMAESLATHLHSIRQATPPSESLEDTETQHSNTRSPAFSPDTYGNPNGNKRKRNFSNRTKSGCHTCRARKKKCDEGKPMCQNCLRGNFNCTGYGEKPKGLKASSSNRPLQIQSKQHEPAQSAYPPDATRHDHWGTVPPPSSLSSNTQPRLPPNPISPEILRQTYHREPWRPRAWPRSLEPPIHPHHAIAPVDFHQIPTPVSGYPQEPPPQHEPWQYPSTSSYRPRTGAGTTVSSRESVGTSSSQCAPRLSSLPFAIPGHRTEKEKMLLGKPYLHFIDDVLLDDRQQCKAAVERYNKAARPSEAVSADERSRFFSAVIDPAKRPAANTTYRDTPAHVATLLRPGRIGYRTIVETPFNCDYGYNISLGDDVVIGAGCYMQDPCEILIGNRTIVGPNVKFYGITASVDAASRKGSQGLLTGGAIIVEEDCFIGGGAIILPHRTIGKGAVVGAGSVVTKNVPPYTVVAGNPAREIRTLGPGTVEDRRMRALIQHENDSSLQEMRARRGCRE